MDINFCQYIVELVWFVVGSKMFFGMIESFEESSDVLFVCGGFGSEVRFVDVVVDQVVDLGVVFFDFRVEVGGVEVDFVVFFFDEIVKLVFVLLV